MDFGERFLIDPALFPARSAGTPGGDLELAIDVAGGPYQLRGLSRRQFEALTERYAQRCLDPDSVTDAVEIRGFRVEIDEFHAIDRNGWINTFDFDYRESSVRIAGDRLMGQIAWRPDLEAAFWSPLEDRSEFLEAFENFFRAVAAYRLLELGGAVLHSAGIVDRGRARIFFGHSGAGKTTLARRCQEAGRMVLSDDVNALYLEEGGPVVAKLPFAGELGRSPERLGPFPLAGLHSITQASTNSWRPLSPATAVAALVSCSPFLNHDPHRLPRLMANLETVVRGTVTGLLACSLEGDFWATMEHSQT